MEFQTREVAIKTEEEDPLLLLPDYLAGLGHSAHLETTGRIPMPVSRDESHFMLTALRELGHLYIAVHPFAINYEEIFGRALVAAGKQ